MTKKKKKKMNNYSKSKIVQNGKETQINKRGSDVAA